MICQNGGQLLHGDGAIDHGGNVNTAALNEGEGAPLGVGVDEGGLDHDLLLEDLKGLDGDLVVGLGQTKEHDGGFLPRQGYGLLHGGGLAHALDHGGDAPDAKLRKPRLHVLGQRGDLPLFGNGLDEDEGGRALQTRQLEHEQADHAAADNGHGVALGDVAHVNIVFSFGYSFKLDLNDTPIKSTFLDKNKFALPEILFCSCINVFIFNE